MGENFATDKLLPPKKRRNLLSFNQKHLPHAHCFKDASVQEKSKDNQSEYEVTEKNERRRFTKPRSRFPRKQRIHFTPLSELLKQDDEDEDDSFIELGTKMKKKRKGRKDLVESSTCTRGNGKGWRCSQLTRDGNSLCEHHLSRARLVRMRKAGSNAEPKKRTARKEKK